MRKITTAFSLLFCAMAIVTPACATELERPVYIELKSGVSLNSGKQYFNDSLGLGAGSGKIKHKDSAVFSGAIGYRFTPNYRFDVEFSYLPDRLVAENWSNGTDAVSYRANLSSLLTSINGYYDFDPISSIRILPYITGGVGMAINKISDTTLYHNGGRAASVNGHSTNNFAWKVGAGANYHINDRMFVDIGYRFVSLGKAESKFGSSASFKIDNADFVFKKLYSHHIMVGIGFNL